MPCLLCHVACWFTIREAYDYSYPEMIDKEKKATKMRNKITSLILVLAITFTSVLTLSLQSVDAASGINRSASITALRKDGSLFDYRIEAGQKLYGYDTLQGACANKGFAYLTLYDRNVEKCRIVKVNIKELKVVKVSAPLPIYHGNNLTYNTRKNRIVATCCMVKGKRAVFISPNTLKVVGHKDIKLGKKVKNLPKKERKRCKGFNAIAYNEKHNCYVGRLRGSGNVIIFDGELNPKKYIKLKGKNTKLTTQGIDSVGNYIYTVQSFKGKRKYNQVIVHSMTGKRVGSMTFPYGKAPGNEMECIFHDGKSFYAGFYLTTSQKKDTKANHVKRRNLLYKINNMI